MATDPVAFERRIWEVLSAALELEGRAREECLETIRAAEPDVHREVARRLNASDRLGSFLDEPAVPRSPRVPSQDALFATGDAFGPYVIQSELGQGGMGSVYLATEPGVFDRSVALKFLSRAMQHDPDARDRFNREAGAIAALSHHFICQIFSHGEEQGQPYIAMEYVRGETLQARLQSGPFASKEAVGIALEVAEALEEAHAQGIVHRDLKPANIMLAGGHVKVLDFGVAKIVGSPPGDDAPTVGGTNSGFAVGTWDYMSPEQRRAEAVDARSDIYALGLVLFEMLTGQRPGALSEFGSDVPAALQRVVRRMLAEPPDERQQSARELREELERVRDALTQGGRMPAFETPDPRIPLRVPGRRVAALAGGLLAVALVAIVAIWWSRPAGPGRVAVLPFDNQGGDAGEPFANGFARDITDGLRRSGIPVVSAEVARMRVDDLPTVVAQELGVDMVVTGSFVVDSERVSVNVSLSKGDTGLAALTRTFDRLYEDISTLPDDIVVELVEFLAPNAPTPTRAPVAEDAGAYGRVHECQNFLLRDDRESVELARDYCLEALRTEPGYVDALVGLGTAYLRLFWNGWGGGVANLEAAKESFDKARELDRSHMRALRGLMQVHYYRGESEEVLKLLSELEGSREDDVEVLLARAQAFALAGLRSEAVRLLEQCLVQDPENESAMWFLSIFSDPDKAVVERYLDRFGSDTWVHVQAAHAGRDDREEARRHFDQAVGELTERDVDEDLVLRTGWYELAALLHAGAFYDREVTGGGPRARAIWSRGRDLAMAKLEHDPDHPGLLLFLASFHGFLGERDAFENAEQRARKAMRDMNLKSPYELLALAAAEARQEGGGAEAVATLIQRLEGGRVGDVDVTLGNLAPELLNSFGYRTNYRPASAARLRELRERYAPAESSRPVAAANGA